MAFNTSPEANRTLGSWNELNLALPAIEGYLLRALYYYGAVTPGQIALVTNAMRVQVFKLLAGLQHGVWYELDRLDTLFFRTARDPFSQGQQVSLYLRWHEGSKALDPHQIDEPTWRTTYGQALRAAVVELPGQRAVTALGRLRAGDCRRVPEGRPRPARDRPASAAVT